MFARIFDIKRYAINDGPGIRTTIFMKGCPLRCAWCHNPESWSTEPQVLYRQSKCIGCNGCGLFPHFVLTDHDDIAAAIAQCPATALETCGREWPMDELMAEIEKERDIMEDSGGGVTLSGGEPLMHPEEALGLLRELGRRGFHRTVDTTLYAAPAVVEAVAEECELLLIDLKLMDAEKHRRYTGVSNELILRNIRSVAQAGHAFVIRIPLIDGINADDENMESTALFLSSLLQESAEVSSEATRPITVHLLPYHDMGKDKHRRILPPTPYNPQHFPMAVPSDAVIARCQQRLQSHGHRVVIGG